MDRRHWAGPELLWDAFVRRTKATLIYPLGNLRAVLGIKNSIVRRGILASRSMTLLPYPSRLRSELPGQSGPALPERLRQMCAIRRPEQVQQIAFYSITSSARRSSDGEIVSPIVVAVLRLTTS